MDTNLEQQVREVMAGGYDLHAHTAPSHFARSLDDFEFARQCDEYGMAGAIIKSHYEPTATSAMIVNKYGGSKTRMYGGVALNCPVGGLNPYAVECALKLGGKIIWLPTRDSENSLKKGMKPNDIFERPPVKLTDHSGKLVPAFYEVLEAVKKYGAYLATGHISPAESMIVCREGLAHGVNMILTHADSRSTNMPLEDQLTLSREGVLVEKVWDNICNGYISTPDMADSIRAIGPEHIIMVTDFGQKSNPSPVIGMHDFVAAMLEQGISVAHLKTMLCVNPARVVGQ